MEKLKIENIENYENYVNYENYENNCKAYMSIFHFVNRGVGIAISSQRPF